MFGSGLHVSYMGGLSNGGLCTYICCHMSGLWLYISSPESRHLVVVERLVCT